MTLLALVEPFATISAHPWWTALIVIVALLLLLILIKEMPEFTRYLRIKRM